VGNFGKLLPAGSLGNRITTYTVDVAHSTLSETGATTTVGAVGTLAADPSGRFVYALTGSFNFSQFRSINDLANIATTSIEGFTIRPADGMLVSMGSPIQITGGQAATSLTMHPSGRFAYLALSNGSLRPYAIDATTGALTAGSDTAALGTPILRAGVDAAGRYLYVATAMDTKVYPIDHATGALGAAVTQAAPHGTVFTSMALGL
jgi:6-phosphogluconolactonase (cycloisomerase 2 family)